jgi:hypothetical protein
MQKVDSTDIEDPFNFKTCISPIVDKFLETVGLNKVKEVTDPNYNSYKLLVYNRKEDLYMFPSLIPEHACRKMLTEIWSCEPNEFVCLSDLFIYDKHYVVKAWIYVLTSLGLLDWFRLENTKAMFLFPPHYAMNSEKTDSEIDRLFRIEKLQELSINTKG